jgi:phosphoribosylamine--glycine ligase
MRRLPPPYVVKTDGLAAGKGVLVTPELREAEADVRAKLAGTSFGEAGRTVVIEEGLIGQELSVMALCDGERAVPLAPARDHKRVGDGDTGPNTGGMGAFSPVPGVGDAVVGEVMERAVLPTLTALRRQGVDYRGVLYAGLMLTEEGLKVIEFNVRFADPETQPVLLRLRRDLVALCAEAASGRLRTEPTFTDEAAVNVVCASKGYPTSSTSGDVIEGIEAAAAVPGVSIHCAGVDRDGDGRLVTAGGRVVGVTALGPDLPTARRRAYEGVDGISFAGMHYRTDIAA